MTNNYLKELIQALRLSPLPRVPPRPSRQVLEAELEEARRRVLRSQAEGSVLLSAGKVNKASFTVIDEDEAQAAQ